MMIVQHHESDYLLKRAIDQFDRLYDEGKDRAKMMAIAIHPYISGQPHRIKYLEAIYDYVQPLRGRAALERRADLRLVLGRSLIGRTRAAGSRPWSGPLRVTPVPPQVPLVFQWPGPKELANLSDI